MAQILLISKICKVFQIEGNLPKLFKGIMGYGKVVVTGTVIK